MAVGAGIMLKNGPAQAVAASGGGVVAGGPVVAGSVGATAVGMGGDSLLAAMKEELFALETDKLQGRLSESEYLEQKAAFEIVLRRALLRGERAADASNVVGPIV
jgi:hypothetical protein